MRGRGGSRAVEAEARRHRLILRGSEGDKFLTDNETKVDLLNNEAIAATIIGLLRERPHRPVTIGVHGDWDAGKSSVLEMIEGKLSGKDGILCLKFNGWWFQGFEDAKIALIEGHLRMRCRLHRTLDGRARSG